MKVFLVICIHTHKLCHADLIRGLDTSKGCSTNMQSLIIPCETAQKDSTQPKPERHYKHKEHGYNT